MKLRLLIISVSLLLLCVCSNAYAWRVAIFDYEDRLGQEGTVAGTIEDGLIKSEKGIDVDQYSGEQNESISAKKLKKIDQSGYDLVITITSDALILAQQYLTKTPTIYTSVNNPLFLGFKTLDAPGGNISGASYYVPVKNQVSFFKQIQPDIKKLGFIFDKEARSKGVEIDDVRDTCESMNLKYVLEEATSKNELPGIANRLIIEGVDAIVVTTSGKIYNNIKQFKYVCDKADIPIYSFHKKGVENGAITALASDNYLIARKLVIPMALKVIYEKENPGNYPAAFLKNNFIYLNRTQAGNIGLIIPEEIVKKADKVY